MRVMHEVWRQVFSEEGELDPEFSTGAQWLRGEDRRILSLMLSMPLRSLLSPLQSPSLCCLWTQKENHERSTSRCRGVSVRRSEPHEGVNGLGSM